MDRRTMLRVSGLGALGFAMGGCATLTRRPPPYTGPALAPVRVSPGRVVRTLVGLRPFRPLGIRVGRERVDGRAVIHNYGHGGAGISLSWGTAEIAAEEAARTGEREAAVIGAGAVGLATARELQRRGFRVTIYTRAVWPDPSVCSGVAPARFTPSFSIIDSDHRTLAFDALYERAATRSYLKWQNLVGGPYGVSWTYRYSPREEAPASADREGSLDTEVDERVLLGPGEHPFPSRYAERRILLTIDTPVFLDAALRDVLLWGGRVMIRTFDGPRSVLALEEPVIVNCSGLGAREVWGDESMTPLRGQLTVLVPQPEVDYIVTAGGGLSMVPRANGLLLGGAPNRRDDWSLEPDQDAVRAVVEGAETLFHGMREPLPPRGPRRQVASPPARPGARGTDRRRFPADELSLELAF